jgi:chromosome partitioning protein
VHVFICPCAQEQAFLIIITFANSKGGVGKSTSCVALAGAYAFAGVRVHIIDLDDNQTVSRWLADDSTRPANLTVSKPDPQLLTEHLQEIARRYTPDVTLIDIAGRYERALTVSIARAHLTIIPACTTEADIFEAKRVAVHIETIFGAFGRVPLYRLLATKVAALPTHAQRHGFKEIGRLKLPLLSTIIPHRAAYEEIGFSGQPPHYADQGRSTTANAVAELDKLKAEVDALLADNGVDVGSSETTAAQESA